MPAPRGAPGTAHEAVRAPRAGATLVEILVALSVLSIVLVSLAALSFHATRRLREGKARTHVAAILAASAGRFDQIPFDSVAFVVARNGGLMSVSGPDFSYQRRVRRAATSQADTIVITIVPTADSSARDSITVVRRRLSTSNPMSTL